MPLKRKTPSPHFCSSKYPIILLIEDDPADAFLIKEQIATFWPDCKFINAISLSDAYESYNDCDHIDLILLDLNLPDGFGSKSVDSVRLFNRNIPMIVITNSDEEFIHRKSLESGADNIISKSSIKNDDFEIIMQKNLESTL